MDLPPIDLSKTGTNVLRKRDLPPFLAGLFNYDLSMKVPAEEAYSRTTIPWNDAKVSVAFRKLDDTEVFKQVLLLGTTSHAFSPSREGWQVGWNLGAGTYHMDPVPAKDKSFDIVVTVEQASGRLSDQITISAFAVYPPNAP